MEILNKYNVNKGSGLRFAALAAFIGDGRNAKARIHKAYDVSCTKGDLGKER